MTYLRPTTCHAFSDIYFLSDSNERTVAVISNFFTSNAPCDEIFTELQTSFDFKVTDPGPGLDSYIFRFWQGEDDNGQDMFLTIEVPVVENL